MTNDFLECRQSVAQENYRKSCTKNQLDSAARAFAKSLFIHFIQLSCSCEYELHDEMFLIIYCRVGENYILQCWEEVRFYRA